MFLVLFLVAGTFTSCTETEAEGLLAALEGGQAAQSNDDGSDDDEDEGEDPADDAEKKDVDKLPGASLELLMKGRLAQTKPKTYELLSKDIRVLAESGTEVHVLVGAVALTNYLATDDFRLVTLPSSEGSQEPQKLTFQLFREAQLVLEKSFFFTFHLSVDAPQLVPPADSSPPLRRTKPWVRPGEGKSSIGSGEALHIHAQLENGLVADPTDPRRLLVSEDLRFRLEYEPRGNVFLSFHATQPGAAVLPFVLGGAHLSVPFDGMEAHPLKGSQINVGGSGVALPEVMTFLQRLAPGKKPLQTDAVFRIGRLNDNQEFESAEYRVPVTLVARPSAPLLGFATNIVVEDSQLLPFLERTNEDDRPEFVVQAAAGVDVAFSVYIGDVLQSKGELVLQATNGLSAADHNGASITSRISASYFDGPSKKVRIVAKALDPIYNLESDESELVFEVRTPNVLAEPNSDRFEIRVLGHDVVAEAFDHRHPKLTAGTQVSQLDALLLKGRAADFVTYTIKRAPGGDHATIGHARLVDKVRGQTLRPGDHRAYYAKVFFSGFRRIFQENTDLIFEGKVRSSRFGPYIGEFRIPLKFVVVDLSFVLHEPGIEGHNADDPNRRLVKDDLVVRARHSLSNYSFFTVNEVLNPDGSKEPKPRHFMLVSMGAPNVDYYDGQGHTAFKRRMMTREGFRPYFGVEGVMGRNIASGETAITYKILPRLPKGHPPVDLNVRLYASQSNGFKTSQRFEDILVTMVSEPLAPILTVPSWVSTGNGEGSRFVTRRTADDRPEFHVIAGADQEVDVWYALYIGDGDEASEDLDLQFTNTISGSLVSAGPNGLGGGITTRIAASYFDEPVKRVRIVAKAVSGYGLESEEAELLFEVRTPNFLAGDSDRLRVRLQSHPYNYGTAAMDQAHPLLEPELPVSALDVLLFRGESGDRLEYKLIKEQTEEVVASGHLRLDSKGAGPALVEGGPAYSRLKLGALSNSLSEDTRLVLWVRLHSRSWASIGEARLPMNFVVYDVGLRLHKPGLRRTNPHDSNRRLVRNDLILHANYSPADMSLLTMHEVLNEDGAREPRPDHYMLLNKEDDASFDFYGGGSYRDFRRLMMGRSNFRPYVGSPETVIGRLLEGGASNVVYKILPKLPEGHPPLNLNVRFHIARDNGARMSRRLEDILITMVANPLPPVVALVEDTGTVGDGVTSEPALNFAAEVGHTINYKVEYKVLGRDSEVRVLSGALAGRGGGSFVPLGLAEIVRMEKEGLTFEVNVEATARSDFGLKSRKSSLKYRVVPSALEE